MDDDKQSKNLEQLLAECDFNAPISDDVKEWLELEPVGRERLERYQPIRMKRGINKKTIDFVSYLLPIIYS